MSKNIDKRVWGVLGKQRTFYSPQKQIEGKTKTPLNSNAFDSWDSKRSTFRRVDGYENAVQQGGTVIGQGTTPVVSPTPSTTPPVTPSPTPSTTPQPTPSITPSSTPYPLPSTPDLWYDSTNVGSIDYISSGGTDYVFAWRSIGTYSKTLTGGTMDTMPQWSGSTILPGSPNVIRFTKNTTAGLRDILSQRFDSSLIPASGLTIFYVLAKPSEYDYSSVGSNGMALQLQLLSGNTSNGGFTPINFQPPRQLNYNIGSGSNNVAFNNVDNGIARNNSFAYSATNLNNKFLITTVLPNIGYPYVEINQSATTLTTPITATTYAGVNQIILGGVSSSGGTITANNNGIEVGEIMVYAGELSISQQEAVQNYLRDKWRYDEWSTPVPTPTPSRAATTLTYVTVTGNSVGSSSYTYTDVPIGASGLVVIAAQHESGGSGATLTSATIGGVSATIATQINSALSTSYTGVAIIYGRVSSGTTTNVTLTYNNATLRSSIGVWRINNNLSDTPYQSQSASGATVTGLSLTFNSLITNQVGVVATTVGVNSLRVSWTNATEQYDYDLGSTGFAGADFSVSTNGNRTVSTSHTSSTQPVTIAGTVWG